MVATNITSGHTRIIPCRKERGGVLEQSGEMSNAGGALPWSIQQRSHTPPSPDVDPRTYTRTTAGSVCAPSRHSCLSIPLPICLHAPLLCRLIERIHHWYSQRLLWCRSSSATVLLRPPPLIRVGMHADRKRASSCWLAWTNLTHAARISPLPPIQNKQRPIFILVQAMHRN